MSRERAFRRELYHLFDIRTYWLQHLVSGPSPGKVPRFTRKRVDRTVSSLQEITTEALLRKLATTWFNDFAEEKKTWRVTNQKGWGRDKKKRNFQTWYEKRFGATGCVYSFWKGTKCVYLGRTGKGGSRPSDHFVKFWFSGITRIDVHEVRAKRPLSALECLATHRFRPSRSKQKTQRKCPLCKIHRRIKAEVNSIFHLRRRKRRTT